MGVIEFKKREEIKILFGIKLPLIVTEFYKESKNKKRAYEIMRDTLNISEGRLINVVAVIDGAGNFVSEKERMKLDLEIEVFDFSIFELDYNGKVDIEDIIKRIKK